MVTKDVCLKAIQAYRDCLAKEQKTYGPEYERLSQMEDEAPAPDPCTDAFNAMIAALAAYPEDLSAELGELADVVRQAMADRNV